MRISGYVARRLLLLFPVMLGISVITFALSNIATDPIGAYITDRTPVSVIAEIRKAYHFDDPLPIQYFYYLTSLVRGDWGLSRSMSNEPVTGVIRRLFPASIELAVVAVLFQIVVGIPLGVISATRKDKALDHGSRLLAISGTAIPVFWLGLLMQYFLFYQMKLGGLPYLPSAGRVNEFVLLAHPLKTITGFVLIDSILTSNFPVFLDALAHIAMPAFVLGFAGLGLITRITRSSMLEVLRQDYITLARAKGLPERIVIYKHALRNAINPTITVMGIVFGNTLSGAPLVETVFSWPGLGRWAALAITGDDLPAIMGFVIVAGFIFVLVNLIVDILYSIADPRVRLG
ncbi:MAG: ABC transporter permease [Candidatus Bathyarchaeia archaeon]